MREPCYLWQTGKSPFSPIGQDGLGAGPVGARPPSATADPLPGVGNIPPCPAFGCAVSGLLGNGKGCTLPSRAPGFGAGPSWCGTHGITKGGFANVSAKEGAEGAIGTAATAASTSTIPAPIPRRPS